MNCHDVVFNLGASAGAISTLAGVLGAVTLAAIALRLGSPPEVERRARRRLQWGSGRVDDGEARSQLGDVARPLLAMPIALFAALLAAYGYAVVAGTTDCAVGTQMSYFFGGQLGLSAALLLFAVAWLFRDYQAHGHAVRNAGVLLVVAVVVILVFLWIGVDDYSESLLGHGATAADRLLVGVSLGGPGLVVVGVRLTVGWMTPPSHAQRHQTVWVQRAMYWILATSIGGTVEALRLNTDPPGPAPFWLWALYGAMVSVSFGTLVILLPRPSDELAFTQ